MKINKLATLIAFAASIGAVKAQTIVDIGGSTAGRSAVHNAILALLGGNATYAYDGTSSAAAATRAIYNGTYNGNAYTIRTYWSGSVNGIEPVRLGTQQSELLATSNTGTSGGQNLTGTLSKATPSAATALEIGFSDIFASTVAKTATDVEDQVAVIPFKWFANKGSTGITNITPGLVRQLYSSGEAKKSLFTGNSSDTSTVYPVGRNSDSGSRATALAEGGYGNVAAVSQYAPTAASGIVTVLGNATNSGSSSGSVLKGVINSTYSGGTLIGYLGASDFAADGVALKWNGVDYSEANIKAGLYTFWGYLHMNRMNTLSGNALSFYNALKSQIEGATTSGLLKINEMQSARDADGAPVYEL